MLMRDHNSDISVVEAIPAATLSADTEGSVIDLSGFEAVEFIFIAGTGLDGTNKFNVEVYEGELVAGVDPVFAELTQVASDDLLVDPLVLNAQGAFKLGYRGYSRFVALKLVEVGTVVGSIVGAVAEKQEPRVGPTE